MSKKTEVVYSPRYGGFSLSEEGFALFLQKKNLQEDTDPWQSIYKCPRHDPDLVAVVKELGSKRASGQFANLQICEISGNRYRIDEYDGNESVQEPEDIDWVEV